MLYQPYLIKERVEITLQPLINHLVFEMNDLVIHAYQFIRLYVLYQYNNNLPLPDIDETFILYSIKTLGNRDNRGKKGKDTELLEILEQFYNNEYQPLLNHVKTNLKNTTFLLLCLIILATFREIGLFIPTSGRTAKILDLETERLWRRGEALLLLLLLLLLLKRSPSGKK